ncbi:T-cell surface glycoprotein CD3 epsilon chain-like [Erpetoichthys calabaricus]|uniref:T-cell surface glycoprotein CD3 epsilon chain n=1 Tax=Erpetoichthys calabaricus TaxID=27687 RepID=A0A8C4SMX9_ERPCA|nr:T-cell surface glycoprotein CD3 epsilon chain-like [Erpetoichthys calabaricus]
MERAASTLLILVIMAHTGPSQAQDAETEAVTEVDVSISDTTVILTCPWDDNTLKKWDGHKWNEEKSFDENTKVFTFNSFTAHMNGLYFCESKGTSSSSHYLYIKVKVCEGCVEMDSMTAAGVIIGDLLVTLGVALMVYFWVQNKKGTTNLGAGGRPVRQDRPPPVPNPDYEPIRAAGRETYSGLNKRT